MHQRWAESVYTHCGWFWHEAHKTDQFTVSRDAGMLYWSATDWINCVPSHVTHSFSAKPVTAKLLPESHECRRCATSSLCGAFQPRTVCLLPAGFVREPVAPCWRIEPTGGTSAHNQDKDPGDVRSGDQEITSSRICLCWRWACLLFNNDIHLVKSYFELTANLLTFATGGCVTDNRLETRSLFGHEFRRYYIYIYMYVCIYICVYVCIYICVYVCMYICMYICICIYMYVYIYICMCVYIYTYIMLIGLMCDVWTIHTWWFIYIYTYTHIYVYIHIHIYKSSGMDGSHITHQSY